MSWSASYPSKDAFEKGQSQVPTNDLSDEAREQLVTARALVSTIIESGVAGNATKDFTITLSGHANPAHEPAPGFANDCIAVSVYQKAAS